MRVDLRTAESDVVRPHLRRGAHSPPHHILSGEQNRQYAWMNAVRANLGAGGKKLLEQGRT
ncbi:hypothetical protein OG393_16475 [Streptomyces sp. NBC_01216]|uniref:hypothetical protein n=1 Tax=Streptomyces sp. NBC_01216 TaxID=2903778 RepID=UPI002E11050F|nr:hypothetical protein OG393_16475 [Streptomyces sp. NBC_01216]